MPDEMYRDIDWMNPGDFSILRVLDTDLQLSPNNIGFNAGLHRKYVDRRCREMHKRGLLNKNVKNKTPFYELTELGFRVVVNDVSPDELARRTALEDDDA